MLKLLVLADAHFARSGGRTLIAYGSAFVKPGTRKLPRLASDVRIRHDLLRPGSENTVCSSLGHEGRWVKCGKNVNRQWSVVPLSCYRAIDDRRLGGAIRYLRRHGSRERTG